MPRPLTLTYLGHSCIKLKQDGVTALIDPFLTHSSTAPCTWQEAAEGVTHIILTHGHGDHVGDTIQIAEKNNIPVIAMVELANWLSKQGVKNTKPANFGGTIELGDSISVTLVPAWHSSATEDGVYLGNPAGLIIQMRDHTIYHAGDTSIFGDMFLINDLYQPDIVLLPIGGVYTMDAKTAVIAAERYFPQAETIIPLHYATFPGLAPDATEFVEGCKLVEITPTVLAPGQSLKF